MTRKLLFTPGPLTTSHAVKQAMLHDAGSRDREFLALLRDIRNQLLALGGVSQSAGYEAILIQGSGTYGVEAVLSSIIPATGRLLVLVNGAYGERMAQIAARHRIDHEVLRYAESDPIDCAAVAARLQREPRITHLAAVHCETSTGMLNQVSAIGLACEEANCTFILDAMSSFGGVPIHLANDRIDFLISSANKCLQGVPGFSFVLARRNLLEASAGTARTVSLDLYQQWLGLEQTGQFRFTPPTHALLAFAEALRELEREGGVAARSQRYASNHQLLNRRMLQLGFRPFLNPSQQSWIITAFYYPRHPVFNFEEFYERLSRRGMVIYPGKVSAVECFRLGNIGDLFEADIHALIESIEAVLGEMGVPVPFSSNDP